MKVSLKDGFEYIPEWNGNKQLPENEQIKVYMKFQTGLDITECFKPDGTIDKEKDWLAMCTSVDNLFIDVKKLGVFKGKRKAVPLDICTMGGLTPLYLELRAAYHKETAIDKKK